MKLVLASASPRRRALLEMLGFSDFRIAPSACGEDVDDLSPADAVKTLALRKARDVARGCAPDETVLAADTLVFLDGEPLGKPADAGEARAMLRRLSGRAHTVYTGVALICGGREMAEAEETAVFFRPLDDGEIDAYIATGEPMDKAGAYGAQGRGAVFIRRIEGDFFNVMGLPLCRLTLMLREMKGQL